MLVNIHLPKNAGTTLNAVLARNFGDRFMVLNPWQEAAEQPKCEPMDGAFFLPPAPKAVCLAALRRAKKDGMDAVSGHWLYPFDPLTAEQNDLQLMTFVRHPVARLLSLYHYERKWSTRRPDIYGEKHCSQKPFEEYLAVKATNTGCLDNWQCSQLAGVPSGSAAIDKLRGFFFVGLVEQWNRSMILLARTIPATGIAKDFDIRYVRLHGASAAQRSGVDLSMAFQRELIERNSEDMALYEYARNRIRSGWLASSGRHRMLARLLLDRAAGHLGRRLGAM